MELCWCFIWHNVLDQTMLLQCHQVLSFPALSTHDDDVVEDEDSDEDSDETMTNDVALVFRIFYISFV
jgi:hypothetical protein